jgi:hypothetical protein
MERIVETPITETPQLKSAIAGGDFYGNPIIGMPDIGAIEYQGEYVPPPPIPPPIPPPPPPVITYYSKQMSATATRNNCPKGYTGSRETYTVPAGKYSSTSSQADADNKALADLSANKQAYANLYGSCIKKGRRK